MCRIHHKCTDNSPLSQYCDGFVYPYNQDLTRVWVRHVVTQNRHRKQPDTADGRQSAGQKGNKTQDTESRPSQQAEECLIQQWSIRCVLTAMSWMCVNQTVWEVTVSQNHTEKHANIHQSTLKSISRLADLFSLLEIQVIKDFFRFKGTEYTVSMNKCWQTHARIKVMNALIHCIYTPLNHPPPLISPALALLYRPFTSLCSQTSSGASTNTSKKGSPAASWIFRALRRSWRMIKKIKWDTKGRRVCGRWHQGWLTNKNVNIKWLLTIESKGGKKCSGMNHNILTINTESKETQTVNLLHCKHFSWEYHCVQ